MVGMVIPDAHMTTDLLIVGAVVGIQMVEVTAAREASLAATVSR